jgi:hypothetical protein
MAAHLRPLALMPGAYQNPFIPPALIYHCCTVFNPVCYYLIHPNRCVRKHLFTCKHHFWVQAEHVISAKQLCPTPTRCHKLIPRQQSSLNLRKKYQTTMATLSVTEDYYKILEVDQSATSQFIVSSYRRLALKIHPDRNAKKGATEAFQLVSISRCPGFGFRC